VLRSWPRLFDLLPVKFSGLLGQKTRPQDKHATSSHARGRVTAAPQSTAVTNTQLESGVNRDQAAEETVADGNGSKDGTDDANPAGKKHGEEIPGDKLNEDPKPGSTKKDGEGSRGQRKQKVAESEAEKSKEKSKNDGKGPSNSRRKAFITLSYIVLAYVLCWSPFHFVFDVSLASPESVSGDLYTATFWLAYINSGLNPFMYAFSSADFRTAVVQIVKCRFCKPYN